MEGKEVLEKRVLETIKVSGKDYVTVNTRLKEFRETRPNYRLLSEIVFHNQAQVVTMNGQDAKKDADICIMATIVDPDGNDIATGMAYEKENSSFINKTSYVENCETSAWGRCLANFGIGIDASVSSADELLNAMKNQ
jgi:hypothetical protein